MAIKGSHTFTITFETPGTQSVTVTDMTSGITATQSGISVAPAAPINLAASAVSTSQINLSWTGSSGATGYLIQQSPNGSSSWTQVGSTSGATTFQETGLASGTTYFYRVIATVGSIDSAASNVANATTSGTAATPDTIWPNSYPPENAYSYGSYEVGVKFTSSVAGVVTGVRFYKQTWMGGYLHVGHLWSSTGTLLATATFTNETSYGWQQVNFSSPVSIQPNTVYIVSFSTGGGYFGITTNYFTAGGVTNGPLDGTFQQRRRRRRGLRARRHVPECGQRRDELLGRPGFQPVVFRQQQFACRGETRGECARHGRLNRQQSDDSLRERDTGWAGKLLWGLGRNLALGECFASFPRAGQPGRDTRVVLQEVGVRKRCGDESLNRSPLRSDAGLRIFF